MFTFISCFNNHSNLVFPQKQNLQFLFLNVDLKRLRRKAKYVLAIQTIEKSIELCRTLLLDRKNNITGTDTFVNMTEI